jgi:ribosomal protein S16
MSRITLDLRKQSHKVVYKLNAQGSATRERDGDLTTTHSNFSTVIFQHQSRDHVRSLDVVTTEPPQTKADADLENRVKSPRQRHSRWLSEGSVRVERVAALETSASMPQIAGSELKNAEAEREWIELGNKPTSVPGASSEC